MPKKQLKRKRSIARQSVIKRKGIPADRLIAWARFSAIVFSGLIIVAWGISWGIMSGAFQSLVDHTQRAVISTTHDGGFVVENLYVEGRHYTSPNALKQALNIEQGQAILAVDLERASDRVHALPWVETATVKRHLPHDIYVTLQERQPMALWQQGKKPSLIDRQGKIIPITDLSPFQEALIVAGQGANKAAIDVIPYFQAEPSLYEKIDAAAYISNRRWNLTLTNGITVKLPERDVPVALRRLAREHEASKLLDKKIKEIDLRDTTRIVIRTLPGAIQNYKADYQTTTKQKI